MFNLKTSQAMEKRIRLQPCAALACLPFPSQSCFRPSARARQGKGGREARTGLAHDHSLILCCSAWEVSRLNTDQRYGTYTCWFENISLCNKIHHYLFIYNPIFILTIFSRHVMLNI